MVNDVIKEVAFDSKVNVTGCKVIEKTVTMDYELKQYS